MRLLVVEAVSGGSASWKPVSDVLAGKPTVSVHQSLGVVASFAFSDAPFEHAASIPSEYTCDGPNVSPPLAWTSPPEDTESQLLVVDDPDASGPGSFTHWVVYNLPLEVTTVPRDYWPAASRLVDTEPVPRTAVNDFGDRGYSGPCPPSGEEHRYLFSIYALDTVLDLEGEVAPMQVVAAMMGHVLDKAVLIGTYRRDEDAAPAQGTRGAGAKGERRRARGKKDGA